MTRELDMAIGAEIQRQSKHLLARAIVAAHDGEAHSDARRLQVNDVEAVAGRGVEARIDGTRWLDDLAIEMPPHAGVPPNSRWPAIPCPG